MTKMTDKPQRDRPREKLQAKGAASLSDFELLQALIGSGNAQADVSTSTHTSGRENTIQ